MLFSDLNLRPLLAQAIAQRGYQEPTPVQALVLAAEHTGKDLLVSARTGSGKTLAFGLAIAGDLLGDGERFGAAAAPRGLVVAPTRELALQVQRELAWLYAPGGGKVRACVGGMDPRREQRMLAEGAHVVVGTPGRLCDHLERGNLDPRSVCAVVLDEADEMLDMGFRDELERILRDVPKDRRTLMFSATLPAGITHLAARYQREATRLAASPEQAHEDIEYRAHLIAPREREHAVVNVLRASEVPGALVFCATREGVNHLHANLVERGFAAVAISGELTQPERVRALTALRDGRARVLVATDVAARGLDLPALELVIHADLPRDAQVLQHRSGRTGRAGRKGVSVLIVPARFRASAERMLKTARIKPTWLAVPAPERIRELDQERLITAITAQCAEVSDEDTAVARQLLEKLGAETLVAALVREQRSTLPAPEELPETARVTAPRPGQRTTSGHERRPAHADARHDTRSEPRTHYRSDSPREARGAARASGDGVWFRINVGREGNADPRWLVPLICRRGDVVKGDIGRIQILARETRVAIAPGAAADFERAVRKPDRKDPGIRIDRLREEGRPSRTPRSGPGSHGAH